MNETVQPQQPPPAPEAKKLKLTKERVRKDASDTDFWPDIAIHG